MFQKKLRIEGAVYGRHYVTDFHYHLIWCTKYRNRIFTTQELADSMKGILRTAAGEGGIDIETMEVMPDHIHLMIRFPPYLSATNAVRILKGRSAALFLQSHPDIRRDQCWGGSLWSPSYYMGTCGSMSKETVERYINDQTVSKDKKRHSSPG